MKITETALEGVLLIEPAVHGDHRGFFLETYHRDKYRENGLDVTFVQDNHSKSSQGILRGLHAQLRKPQGKLVRAIEGEIFDVAVDMRRGSPTFGQWVGELLSAENFRQLYIPPDFLHGFYVVSDVAQVEYKCTDVYDPGHELGVAWDDPDIGIEWPLPNGEGGRAVPPVLSTKDADAPRLREIVEQLPAYAPGSDSPGQ